VPANQGNIEGGSVAATTQDILILLLPYLSSSEVKELFQFSLSEEVLSSEDNAIQKRGYKILTKLIETEKVPVDDASSILKRLDGLLEGVSQAAKKV
jgi:ribosomal RNA-processing protein 12